MTNHFELRLPPTGTEVWEDRAGRVDAPCVRPRQLAGYFFAGRIWNRSRGVDSVRPQLRQLVLKGAGVPGATAVAPCLMRGRSRVEVHSLNRFHVRHPEQSASGWREPVMLREARLSPSQDRVNVYESGLRDLRGNEGLGLDVALEPPVVRQRDSGDETISWLKD